jgi:hypothetical protein
MRGSCIRPVLDLLAYSKKPIVSLEGVPVAERINQPSHKALTKRFACARRKDKFLLS